jgi:putrescine transport system ATP-binding protein
VQGTIRDLSYFGSFTVYQLALASGATLKVSQSNVSRHRDDQLTWGDTAWASWLDSAQVVLTQ